MNNFIVFSLLSITLVFAGFFCISSTVFEKSPQKNVDAISKATKPKKHIVFS